MVLGRVKRYALFFFIGAAGYAAIEIIWRGRTHWSMALAGGLCFILFSLVAEGFAEWPLVIKAVLCAVGVTAVELVLGLVFNVMLGMNVWDYSHIPLNLMGQICPLTIVCIVFKVRLVEWQQKRKNDYSTIAYGR